MSGTDLVTVIIPAYNAATTIDETLRSVRSQTYRKLEILVIDDGSTDTTADIARGHAALDPRVRLVCQPNEGVAAARNRGMREAAANLIAFVDADDLWSPDKIEKQIAALKKCGHSVALVYTWSAIIDEASRIIDASHQPPDAGDVLERMCLGNIVGNGSSVLVTKAALEEVGGFDPSLKEQRAQGCEDLQFYFRVAERHHFAVVPEWLTGYRRTSNSMSGDLLQMQRSYMLVADEMRRKHPRLERAVATGTARYIAGLFRSAIRRRRLADVRFGALLFSMSPTLTTRILADQLLFAGQLLGKKLRYALRRNKRDNPSGFGTDLPRFIIGDPDQEA